MALKAVLDSEEYRLTTASSGMEAVARLYERDFALILLDVQMPAMNGFETAQVIRDTSPSRQVPIIFITAINKDILHVHRGYESGAVDYLFKPFDPHILRSKVRTFAELYRKNLQLKNEMQEKAKMQEEILQISEREQKRIGRDLHDGVAQQLAAVSLMCRSVWQSLKDSNPQEAEAVLQILKLSQKALQEARDTARSSYPIELETLGLLGGLEELAASTGRVFNLDCRLQCDQPLDLWDEEACVHLYRIAQEAVHNAVRHGKARNIRIRIALSDDHVVLAVTDDGDGLPENYSATPGMGLRIMDYRAKMLGGSLTLESMKPGGTTVVCRFPRPAENVISGG